MDSLLDRAARHAALGDPMRLAIVDELNLSDRAPIELRRRLGIESNLLAHHLDVLEAAGLISRAESSGDGRRRYVHLRDSARSLLGGQPLLRPRRALFVCSRNSARSQLAAGLWRKLTGASAVSAGTHPSAQVHPGAKAAAARNALELDSSGPRSLATITRLPTIVVTVCDQAHEELDPPAAWLHWSIPDPVAVGTKAAFDATVADLRSRITSVVDTGGAA